MLGYFKAFPTSQRLTVCHPNTICQSSSSSSTNRACSTLSSPQNGERTGLRAEKNEHLLHVHSKSGPLRILPATSECKTNWNSDQEERTRETKNVPSLTAAMMKSRNEARVHRISSTTAQHSLQAVYQGMSSLTYLVCFRTPSSSSFSGLKPLRN